MKAALAGRQDPKLVVAGRTGAVAVTGVEDAIARARAYEAAGVDAMFFSGVKTRAQLEAIHAAIKIPILLGSIEPELSDKDYLSAHGVRIALQGHLPFAAAVKAVHDTLKALRDGVPPKQIEGVASADLMKRVTRGADYDRWTKDFLGG
jgi:carboxyvinyl-carboxyphosphonate phosphorylmutase